LRDRKAVARYAGLTGSPDESGARRREKGLARASATCTGLSGGRIRIFGSIVIPCEHRDLTLAAIRPFDVATYIEGL
jgi:hypothetical protein